MFILWGAGSSRVNVMEIDILFGWLTAHSAHTELSVSAALGSVGFLNVEHKGRLPLTSVLTQPSEDELRAAASGNTGDPPPPLTLTLHQQRRVVTNTEKMLLHVGLSKNDFIKGNKLCTDSCFSFVKIRSITEILVLKNSQTTKIISCI